MQRLLLACVVVAIAAGACSMHDAAKARSAPAVPAPTSVPPDPFADDEARVRAPVEPPAERNAPRTLIRHATVLTATGARHHPGFVLMEKGRITAVGAGDGPSPDDGTTVVEAQGKFVTPGIVDPHSHLGVYAIPQTIGHDDGNELTDPITASARAEDAFWPEDPAIERAVAGGVTTIGVLPGSGNLIGGRGVVMHLLPQRGARAMRLPGAPEIMKMACGENPKRVYRDQKRAPFSRMGSLRAVREAFLKAQKYAREWQEWSAKQARAPADRRAQSPPGGAGGTKGDDAAKPPDRDQGLETLALVLRGDILVQWHCYQADDMLAALSISDEFGFKVRAFHHALEAYKIRDVLAARGVAVATWDDWWGMKMEAYDGIPENLALLTESGARAAVHSDSPIAIQFLNQAASKALSAGRAAGIKLDEDDAIRWLTINPAWALGVDTQVGTLEPGKRADVVVWSDDPFSTYSRAQRVYVDGHIVYDVDHEAAPWSDFEVGTRSEPAATIPATRGEHGAARSAMAHVIASAAGPVAIMHGKVHVPGAVPALQDANVVLSSGKVQAVGKDLAAPAGARVIDARGKEVTPGFIDADTDVGVIDVDQEPQTNETEVRGHMNPALRMADGYNPRSAVVSIARSGGVTSAVVVPRHGVLAGQSLLVDLTGESLHEAVVRAPLAQFAYLDEEAAHSALLTRNVMWLELRQALDDARFYAAHRAAYDANGARPLVLRREGLEALVPVVRAGQPLVVEVHRASDIESALELADDYHVRLVLLGATEGWMTASEIARRNVPVILDPLEDLPERFDRLHARADNAALLSRAGVSVVIASFSTFGVRLLWQHAGNAVRFGMDHDAAIRAVTEAPADVFGLDGYGRLAPGAVANVVVWSGDPLQTTTRVEHVFIHGLEQPLQTRQSMLLARYRRLPVAREGTP